MIQSHQFDVTYWCFQILCVMLAYIKFSSYVEGNIIFNLLLTHIYCMDSTFGKHLVIQPCLNKKICITIKTYTIWIAASLRVYSHLIWSGPNQTTCVLMSPIHWTENLKQEKSMKCKNGQFMEIFRSTIFIILLIWCYQLLTQYEETYEHHLIQRHLYDVVIRSLLRRRCAARRFQWREHALHW